MYWGEGVSTLYNVRYTVLCTYLCICDNDKVQRNESFCLIFFFSIHPLEFFILRHEINRIKRILLDLEWIEKILNYVRSILFSLHYCDIFSKEIREKSAVDV